MAWISLGSLLIFSHHSCRSRAAAGGPRCVGEAELRSRSGVFLRRQWDRRGPSARLPPGDTRTCEQTARETRGDLSARSLAPWKYSLNRDVDRFPHEIAFAECLCQGCIINHHEDLSYNSVPVFAQMMVMKKSRCPSNQNKYRLKKDFIRVPVACTCAVPRST
ncbi:interleukin-17C-like isoform X2 [Trachinotus anak]|uniref:interleukin-17C-like isoform X2 n=1 Tax=Trachinotus anak TaxID=443729 RepID=UPI0039F1EE82